MDSYEVQTLSREDDTDRNSKLRCNIADEFRSCAAQITLRICRSPSNFHDATETRAESAQSHNLREHYTGYANEYSSKDPAKVIPPCLSLDSFDFAKDSTRARGCRLLALSNSDPRHFAANAQVRGNFPSDDDLEPGARHVECNLVRVRREFTRGRSD